MSSSYIRTQARIVVGKHRKEKNWENEKQKLLGIVIDRKLRFQFSYCPLVWLCCNRNCDNRINHLHESALRIVDNDNVSSFEDL